MSILKRTLDHMGTRGLRATVRSARRRLAARVDRLLDAGFDRRIGTDTSGRVENSALREVPPASLLHAIRYEPTRARPFLRLLRAAGIPPHGTFVDLGCGKGRVLMLAAQHGFTRVTGVDHAASLCEIARANLALLRARSELSFEAAVHAMDAADYRFTPDDTVVFLYNPFDGTVMRPVIANLCASLQRHPRSLWLVYNRPEQRSVIEESGALQAAGTWWFGGCEFAVFCSRASAAPPPAR